MVGKCILGWLSESDVHVLSDSPDVNLVNDVSFCMSTVKSINKPRNVLTNPSSSFCEITVALVAIALTAIYHSYRKLI